MLRAVLKDFLKCGLRYFLLASHSKILAIQLMLFGLKWHHQAYWHHRSSTVTKYKSSGGYSYPLKIELNFRLVLIHWNPYYHVFHSMDFSGKKNLWKYIKKYLQSECRQNQSKASSICARGSQLLFKIFESIQTISLVMLKSISAKFK